MKQQQNIFPTCPACGSFKVSSTLKQQEFTYGISQNAVKLSVSSPVWNCSNCNFEYTDSSTEKAKDETVRDYLKSKRK